jgi:hypothetical protein
MDGEKSEFVASFNKRKSFEKSRFMLRTSLEAMKEKQQQRKSLSRRFEVLKYHSLLFHSLSRISHSILDASPFIVYCILKEEEEGRAHNMPH